MSLIELGFDHVCDFDGVKLYRIPKSRWRYPLTSATHNRDES